MTAPMIHATAPENVDSILAHGLRPGGDGGLTGDVSWHDAFYGAPAVFLSTPDSDFLAVHQRYGPELAILEVDVEGLPLVADLVSLVDAGGKLSGGMISWWIGREPPSLKPHLRAGAVGIRELLDPGSPACRAAITLTGTAAHLGTVPADRISLPVPALIP